LFFRFTIEPVPNEAINSKKRARTASGGNQAARQIPQVQRLRRNAFSSASIASTNEDLDETMSIESEGSQKQGGNKLHETLKNWNNENSLHSKFFCYNKNYPF
jgi:hypothetical protein